MEHLPSPCFLKGRGVIIDADISASHSYLRNDRSVSISAQLDGKVLHFVSFRTWLRKFACPLRLLPSNYCPSFTTLENHPFAVPIEPRPLPPKTGRAQMMKSAMRRSS